MQVVAGLWFALSLVSLLCMAMADDDISLGKVFLAFLTGPPIVVVAGVWVLWQWIRGGGWWQH